MFSCDYPPLSPHRSQLQHANVQVVRMLLFHHTHLWLNLHGKVSDVSGVPGSEGIFHLPCKMLLQPCHPTTHPPTPSITDTQDLMLPQLQHHEVEETISRGGKKKENSEKCNEFYDSSHNKRIKMFCSCEIYTLRSFFPPLHAYVCGCVRACLGHNP